MWWVWDELYAGVYDSGGRVGMSSLLGFIVQDPSSLLGFIVHVVGLE